jgi:hypothetical protein
MIIKIFSRRFELDGGSKYLPKPTKYLQLMFCVAVKVDMANFKETSFNKTVSSTLSLITLLCEDLLEAINI